jgi:hypothetical protein
MGIPLRADTFRDNVITKHTNIEKNYLREKAGDLSTIIGNVTIFFFFISNSTPRKAACNTNICTNTAAWRFSF